jgi:hypothetical protein
MTSAQLTMPTLPFTIPTSWFFNVPVLLIVLAVFFVLYCIMTGVLWYHWSKYGMREHGVLVARTLFLFVSVILFCVALSGLYYF